MPGLVGKGGYKWYVSESRGPFAVPVGHRLLNPLFYCLLRLFYLAYTTLYNVNKLPF